MKDLKRKIDSLMAILEDWADWQRGYSGIRGYASHTPGLYSGYVSKSYDDLQNEVEWTVNKLVDAAIDDLPAGQAAAVKRRYGISAVFRFPRGNYEELLLDAHMALLVSLPKKGVVI